MGAGKRHTPTESDQASKPASQPPNTPQEIEKPQKRDDGFPRNPNKRPQYIEKAKIPTPPSPQSQICATTKSVGSSQIATSSLWYPLLRPKPQHFSLSLSLSLSLSFVFTAFFWLLFYALDCDCCCSNPLSAICTRITDLPHFLFSSSCSSLS
jgi:hypothetical protein